MKMFVHSRLAFLLALSLSGCATDRGPVGMPEARPGPSADTAPPSAGRGRPLLTSIDDLRDKRIGSRMSTARAGVSAGVAYGLVIRS